jgi:hypothetical protein
MSQRSDETGKGSEKACFDFGCIAAAGGTGLCE